MKKTKLETDYEVLLQGIEKLSVLTIGAYENTLEALKTLDLEIALQIIKQDQDIDDLQEDITEESTIFIIRQQPVASDLRKILMVMRLATEYERIADYTKNLAEYIICGEPTVVDYFYSDFDEEYIDQIYSQFNSLSIVYRKPEEKFTKYTGLEDEEERKEEEERTEPPKQVDPAQNINQPIESNMVSLNETNIQPQSNVVINPVTEESLHTTFTLDETQYQNYWGEYAT